MDKYARMVEEQRIENCLHEKSMAFLRLVQRVQGEFANGAVNMTNAIEGGEFKECLEVMKEFAEYFTGELASAEKEFARIVELQDYYESL